MGEVLPSVGWPSSPWGRPSSPVAYCSLVLYNPSTWLLCSGGCSDIIIPISSEILPTANKWNCSALRGGGPPLRGGGPPLRGGGPPLRGLALLSVGEALFSGRILFTGVVQPKQASAAAACRSTCFLELHMGVLKHAAACRSMPQRAKIFTWRTFFFSYHVESLNPLLHRCLRTRW